MNNILYPTDITKNPYVYSKTLENKNQDFYNNVNNYLNNDYLFKPNNSQSKTKAEAFKINIKNALNFLNDAINFEKQKEENFINKIIEKKNPRETITLDPTDFNGTVKQISMIITGEEEFKKSLQKEVFRIQERHKLLESQRTVTKNLINTRIYQLKKFQHTESRTLNLLERQGKGGLQALTLNNRTTFGSIANKLLEKYADRILSIDSNEKITLNPAQLTILIKELSEIIYTKYKASASETSIQKFLETIFNEQGEQEDKGFIKTLEAYMEELIRQGELLNSIANQYKLKEDSFFGGKKEFDELRNRLTKLIKINEAKEETKEAIQKYIDILNSKEKPNSLIKAQMHYNSESSTAIQQALLGLTTRVLGNLGGAADVAATYKLGTIDLSVEPNNPIAESPMSQSNLEEMIRTDKKNNEEEEQIMQEIKEGAKESYLFLERQTSQLEKSGLLKNDKDISILVLTSVKDYDTIGESSEKYNSNVYTGRDFGEKKLGNKLQNQLKILQFLALKANSTFISYNWLLSSVINTSPGLIGDKNKTSLEDYLSVFASFLMFDDFFQQIELNQKIDKTDTTVHLYRLNAGAYVPQSCVMYQTYANLSNIYIQNSKITTKNSGARIVIKSNYKFNESLLTENQENQSNYVEIWRAETDKAINQTSLKIEFLEGFVNTLYELYENLFKKN